MILWLRDLMDRFDGLSLRERVLVLAAAIGLVLLLWDSVMMGPLERQRRARLQQVEMLRAEVEGLERSAEAVVAQSAANPGRDPRAMLDKLKQEIADLDGRLAGATSGLIEPREMGHVLEQLLARTSRLTLRGLRTLPPQAVISPQAAGPAGAEPAPRAEAAQIWRHGVEVEFEATYMETLALLEALEALPWRFFWDHIEFVVDQHPRGRTKLLLYTLGLQEGWIGV